MLQHYYNKDLFITWRNVGAVPAAGDNNIGLVCRVKTFTRTEEKKDAADNHLVLV